jgi:Reverse transcriptase (RNA-dependent DNA polymerase)
LLSNIGKIYEKIILRLLEEFESEKKIIIPQQFGFRQGHSTVHQILRITECASFGFNKNQSTGIALLDLEKAFDVIWHNGILFKLHKLQFPLYIIKLIYSFLNNRKSCVSINNHSSEYFPIIAGVPQGSTLSPFLFNLFINDIPKQKNCELALYADDTVLFCKKSWKNLKSLKFNLLKSLKSISQFFQNWKIKINATKTKFLTFTKSTTMKNKLRNDTININNDCFKWDNQVTYLGVELDQGLTYKNHIENSIKKAQNTIRSNYCLIKRNSHVPLHTKLTLYKALIRPILTYACPIFSNCAKAHVKKIQIQQNKILRMICNSPYFTRNDDLHANTKLPTIREFINKLTNNFYFRSQNHASDLINNLGRYHQNHLDFRIKHRLPRQK